MSRQRYTGAAGDFITIDFNPQAGHEQAGRRPALIVSETAYNRAARLAIVCPVTTQAKGYPFEVPIPVGGAIKGVVLADHVKSLDLVARGAKFVERAPQPILEAVRQNIAAVLGLTE